MRLSRLSGLLNTVKTATVPPTFVYGDAGYGKTSLTLAAPATTEIGDLIIILGEGIDVSMPAGWNTYLAWSPDCKLFYRFATTAGAQSGVLSRTSGAVVGTMCIFRGVDTGAPFNAHYTGTDTGTTFSAGGVTTTVNNCMIVVMLTGKDTTGFLNIYNYSKWANSNLVSITEACDKFQPASPYARGGAAAYGVMPIAGSTGNTTATADHYSKSENYITLALTPAS